MPFMILVSDTYSFLGASETHFEAEATIERWHTPSVEPDSRPPLGIQREYANTYCNYTYNYICILYLYLFVGALWDLTHISQISFCSQERLAQVAVADRLPMHIDSPLAHDLRASPWCERHRAHPPCLRVAKQSTKQAKKRQLRADDRKTHVDMQCHALNHKGDSNILTYCCIYIYIDIIDI